MITRVESFGTINDILNALFMEMELGGVIVSDPNTKYSYRVNVENQTNYNKLIVDTRLLAEGWKNATASKCNITGPSRENTRLPARITWFRRRVVTNRVSRFGSFSSGKTFLPTLIRNSNSFLIRTRFSFENSCL